MTKLRELLGVSINVMALPGMSASTYQLALKVADQSMLRGLTDAERASVLRALEWCALSEEPRS